MEYIRRYGKVNPLRQHEIVYEYREYGRFGINYIPYFLNQRGKHS